MNIVGVIPARMGSSRFPGKPLAPICGLPMIEHVYRRSQMSKALDGLYVATCDREIEQAVLSFGGQAVMTKDTHERASDRVAEAMLKIEGRTGQQVDLLVMIQGDEPMVEPRMIDEAVEPFEKDKTIQVANLLAKRTTPPGQNDPNEIKVVVDKNFFALYFSRAPIPHNVRKDVQPPGYKQVCIIPFRRDFLLEFNSWAQTPLEIAESVDMMRVLENGGRVRMVLTAFETYSVDTPQDLQRVERLMRADPLYQKYRH